ncbi:MAG: AraC family transcriptional regulator [Stygiobacter sp.]|nr:MAG: AraC family transcriptional regulator [Stygiobacter sp.]
MMPCDILRARVRGIDDCTGRTDFANPLLVPVVRTLAAQFLKFDIRETSEVLERTLIDLVALMVETPHAVPMDLPLHKSLATITHERIVDFISDNFADPELSPKTVASVLKISTRYLHKLFHAHGISFEQTLMKIRLAEAHRLLASPVVAGKKPSICEIAFACGFSSQAHFSTRFRNHFGTTPRSVVSNTRCPPIFPKLSE